MDILANEELKNKIEELVYDNSVSAESEDLIAVVKYDGRVSQVFIRVTNDEDGFIDPTEETPVFEMHDNGLEVSIG